MVLRDESAIAAGTLNRSTAFVAGVFMISPAQPTARGGGQTPRCAPAATLASISFPAELVVMAARWIERFSLTRPARALRHT